MIEAHNISKKFAGHPSAILSALHVRVEPGETIAIVGRSGAGKSTLLRILCGLEEFDDGHLVVDDTRVMPAQSSRALLGRVGLVSQTIDLIAHLSVLNNCLLAPCVGQKRARDVVTAEAIALLATLGLAGKEHAFPSQLSGGQRQRVAIARALIVKPRVLLYDEPTSALDPELREEVARTIRDVDNGTAMTQIIVTHDLEFAHRVASRVLRLVDGLLLDVTCAPAEDAALRASA